MAIFDDEFLNNPSFHSVAEERIQNEVQEFLLGTKKTVSKEIFDYVSPLRKILFEWYPFSPDSRILEIGGNMGELTELFCQKGKEVVSIELNEERRKIILGRCYRYKNLQVTGIPFNKIFELGKFDYIVIHNCFGYLKKYYSSENTYVDFLKLMYSCLNIKGVILIATHNRIGVKYLAGAVEEHTKKIFTGINNFDEYDKVRTFTKEELIRIIKKARIPQYKFYYPFPSYVFPTEIHTAQSLKCFCYGEDDFTTDYEMPEFFDRKILAETLRRENVLESFVNSFLIELSDYACCNVLYYKPDLEKRKHKSGYIVCGHDMNDAIIKYLNLFEEHGVEKNFEENIYYLKANNVKICFGNIGTLPSSVRLKEKMQQTIDDAIKEDNTQNLCEKVCSWWRRIALSIRQMQEEIVIQNTCCIEYKFDSSIDNIYLVESEGIVLFFIPEIINFIKKNKEYVIWKLVYDWYKSDILNYQSRRKHIFLKLLYDACEINMEKIDTFRNIEKKMQAKWTDKKEIFAHTYAKYELGLLEPTQILKHGVPIITEYQESLMPDIRQNTLLFEDKLLKDIRK